MNQNIDQIPYSSKLLNSIPGVLHSFSTKLSSKPLNIFCTQQVHGHHVLEIIDQQPETLLNEPADGCFTIKKDKLLGVQTADCLPVLFADKSGNAVAAIHAGWRGLLSGILLEAVKFFKNKNIPVDQIYVAIGPSIQVCCFEVSKEIETKFLDQWGFLLKKEDNFSNFRAFPKSENGIWLDLQKIATLQLKSVGIPEKNIDNLKICTYCSDAPLASYRKSTHENNNSTKERQWSWITLCDRF